MNKVEDAITEEQSDRDLSWSEIHYDKFGKEFDEVHRRESKVWFSEDSVKKLIDEEIDDWNLGDEVSDEYLSGAIIALQTVKNKLDGVDEE